MNFVHIAGFIGKDAETRMTSNGMKVTSFSVAVTIKYGDKEETVWWRVSAWGDRWEKLAPYLVKGKGICVGGRLRKPEIYNDQAGRPQVSLDIQADYINFAPSSKADQGGGDSYSQPSQSQSSGDSQPMAYNAANGTGKSNYSADDDQVPF